MTNLLEQVPVPLQESTRKSKLTPEERRKRMNARCYANSYARRGAIERRPCFVCGGVAHKEFHHPDYNEPLEVICLCRRDHKLLTHNKMSLIPSAVQDQFKFDRVTRILDYKRKMEKIVRDALRSVRRDAEKPQTCGPKETISLD